MTLIELPIFGWGILRVGTGAFIVAILIALAVMALVAVVRHVRREPADSKIETPLDIVGIKSVLAALALVVLSSVVFHVGTGEPTKTSVEHVYVAQDGDMQVIEVRGGQRYYFDAIDTSGVWQAIVCDNENTTFVVGDQLSLATTDTTISYLSPNIASFREGYEFSCEVTISKSDAAKLFIEVRED